MSMTCFSDKRNISFQTNNIVLFRQSWENYILHVKSNIVALILQKVFNSFVFKS